MRIVFSVLIMTTLFFFFSCGERKNDSLDKAVLQFALLCPGGSASACVAQVCTPQYPEVTTENFTAVDTCTANCSSNCNLQNIYLILESQ
ncbi:MAG: hypothetical protein GW938_03245 [Leptospira sp.]|nr:hypothetical protein [Leptospira sp.]NCS94821.1 hypothetical protein [Leptospira sp.]